MKYCHSIESTDSKPQITEQNSANTKRNGLKKSLVTDTLIHYYIEFIPV